MNAFLRAVEARRLVEHEERITAAQPVSLPTQADVEDYFSRLDEAERAHRERHPRVRRLRDDEGLTWREIAARLGVTARVARYSWLTPEQRRAAADKGREWSKRFRERAKSNNNTRGVTP